MHSFISSKRAMAESDPYIITFFPTPRNAIVSQTLKCVEFYIVFFFAIHFLSQNSMVNQPQGHNSMDSSAALLQQQHNFDVQVSVFESSYEF